MKNKLSLINIRKIFDTPSGELVALDDISIDVYETEILAIVGSSGCGKSTLLNIISSLDIATSGKCIFASDNPKISYMFQNDALLPWRTVLDNATIGLELAGTLDIESKLNVEKMLDDYGLGDFLNAYPRSLSGGMKQRVALARSLAVNPDLILLDEPFSALDYYTRIKIGEYVHDVIKKSNITAIMITHDIQEALSLGDRVVVLTHRPSRVKNIYDIPFKNEKSIISKRDLEEFNHLYKSIWSDLDEKI